MTTPLVTSTGGSADRYIFPLPLLSLCFLLFAPEESLVTPPWGKVSQAGKGVGEIGFEQLLRSPGWSLNPGVGVELAWSLGLDSAP